MNGIKWTLEHKRLLKTDMTNEQIAEITGRPVSAVKRTRYDWTGHNVEAEKWRVTKPERLSKVAGECRVVNLARKMNIKLLDVK